MVYIYLVYQIIMVVALHKMVGTKIEFWALGPWTSSYKITPKNGGEVDHHQIFNVCWTRKKKNNNNCTKFGDDTLLFGEERFSDRADFGNLGL